MIIKLRNLINSQQSLNRIIEKDMPIAIAYKLSKLARAVKSELASIEESRIKCIQKYGEKFEGKWRVSEENNEKFQEEMNQLLDEEVELNCDPIKVSDLGDFSISAVDVANLDALVSD